MSLPNGIYEIRFVPNCIQVPFVGGLYATGETINAPVRAQALNPSASGEQKWKVEAVQGKPDTYIISYPGFPQPATHTGVGPVLPGMGLAGKKHRGHNEPVRLTVEIAHWVLTQVDAKNGVYRISEPTDGMVGAIHAVTEEDGRLLVKSYPVIHNVHLLPQWQLIPAKN